MIGRIFGLTCLIAFLGGCTLLGQQKEPVVADVPAAAPAEPEVPAPVLPSPRPADLEARYAPLQIDPPQIEAETIVGMNFSEMRALLGEPNEQELRAPAEVWTYAGEICSLQVFFYPQVGENGYRALLYEMDQQEEPAEDADKRTLENACLSALLEERSSGRSVV